MVLPVSAGRVKTVDTGRYYLYRYWRRQKKPYTLPLDFQMETRQVVYQQGYTGSHYSQLFNGDCSNLDGRTRQSVLDQLYARSYDKFVSKTQDGKSASLGISLLEINQSFEMIRKRALSMAKAAKELRRGNLVGAYRALSMSEDVKKSVLFSRKITARNFANSYLELIFGWQPLIEDIYSAVEVLQSDPPINRLIRTRTKAEGTTNGTYSSAGGTQLNTRFSRWKVEVSLRGTVSVSNPNLALANQLGLVNPVKVIWESIPMSFLVDWFLHLNSFLGSYSAFWGYSVKNTSFTQFWSQSCTWDSQNFLPQNFQFNWKNGGYSATCYRFGYPSNPNGFPVPPITARMRLPAHTTSLQSKAITAVTLLIQQLTGRK